MKYTETLPSNCLCDLVQDYWRFEIPKSAENGRPFVQESLPENTISIVFINQPHFQGIRILGPQTKRYLQEVYPGSSYLGIRLNPWIQIPSMVEAKESILNQTIAAPGFLHDTFREISIPGLSEGFSAYDLLEKGLLRLMESEMILVDPLVKYICMQLRGETKIGELVSQIPLSTRPIQKKFKSTTGISMVKYRSIHRLQKTVKMIYMENDNITNAAFRNNYTDHSHFMNTFKKFMETPLKDFLRKADKVELSMRN